MCVISSDLPLPATLRPELVGVVADRLGPQHELGIMVGEAPGHRFYGMLLHLDEPVGLAINLPGQVNLLTVRKHERGGGIQYNIIAHVHVIA